MTIKTLFNKLGVDDTDSLNEDMSIYYIELASSDDLLDIYSALSHMEDFENISLSIDEDKYSASFISEDFKVSLEGDFNIDDYKVTIDNNKGNKNETNN